MRPQLTVQFKQTFAEYKVGEICVLAESIAADLVDRGIAVYHGCTPTQGDEVKSSKRYIDGRTYETK